MAPFHRYLLDPPIGVFYTKISIRLSPVHMKTRIVIGSPIFTPMYTSLHVTRPSTVLVLPQCHYTTENPPQMMTNDRVVPLTQVHFLMLVPTSYPTSPLLSLRSTQVCSFFSSGDRSFDHLPCSPGHSLTSYASFGSSLLRLHQRAALLL